MQVVNEVMPYVVAAAGSYGSALLTQGQQTAVDATVEAGRRLTQRIFGASADAGDLPEVLADVIDDPGDQDSLGALRRVIRKALETDEELAEEVRQILREAHPPAVNVTAGGERSVAGNNVSGIVLTGDNARVVR